MVNGARPSDPEEEFEGLVCIVAMWAGPATHTHGSEVHLQQQGQGLNQLHEVVATSCRGDVGHDPSRRPQRDR